MKHYWFGQIPVNTFHHYSPDYYSQNTDWADYAQKFGKVATVTALGMAVVEFLLLHWISATYSICLSAALAVIELPWVYAFIGACSDLKYGNCMYLYLKTAYMPHVLHTHSAGTNPVRMNAGIF